MKQPDANTKLLEANLKLPDANTKLLEAIMTEQTIF
jgi:hypothetical protein